MSLIIWQDMLMVRKHRHLHRDSGPGLWDKVLRHGQASCGDLADQAPPPPQTQQPAAARVAWGRHYGSQQRPQIRHLRALGLGPNRHRTAHTQHPSGGHGHGHPEARRPIGRRPRGVLPLPAPALATFEALFTPAAQPLPRCLTTLRCQVSQQPPRGGVALVPPGHEGTRQTARRRATGGPSSPPALAPTAHQLLEPIPTGLALRTQLCPLIDPSQRMPAQADKAPEEPARP